MAAAEVPYLLVVLEEEVPYLLVALEAQVQQLLLVDLYFCWVFAKLRLVFEHLSRW